MTWIPGDLIVELAPSEALGFLQPFPFGAFTKNLVLAGSRSCQPTSTSKNGVEPCIVSRLCFYCLRTPSQRHIHISLRSTETIETAQKRQSSSLDHKGSKEDFGSRKVSPSLLRYCKRHHYKNILALKLPLRLLLFLRLGRSKTFCLITISYEVTAPPPPRQLPCGAGEASAKRPALVSLTRSWFHFQVPLTNPRCDR